VLYCAGIRVESTSGGHGALNCDDDGSIDAVISVRSSSAPLSLPRRTTASTFTSSRGDAQAVTTVDIKSPDGSLRQRGECEAKWVMTRLYTSCWMFPFPVGCLHPRWMKVALYSVNADGKPVCQSAIESEPRGEHHGGDKSVLGGWLKTPPSTTEALFDERVSPFSSSSSAYPTTSPLTSSASYRHHPPSTSSYNTAPHAFGSSSSSTAGVTNAGSLPQGRQNPVHWSSAHPVPSGSYRRYGSVNDSSAAAAAARYYPTPRSSIGSESSCRVSLSPARERAVLQQPKRDEPQPQAQLRLQQQQSQETWNQGERALPQV
jgi:hypothetical protein